MADMKTVIATTVIHRAVKPGVRGDKSKGLAAVKPETQVIKPGSRFVPKDQAEFDELLRAGAIKMADEPPASLAELEAEAAASDKPKSTGKRGKKPAATTDDDNLV